MKVKVIESFESARGIIPVGQIIEISETLLEKLKGKVEQFPIKNSDNGKQLPHYCQTGDCWCSGKLPESNYPSGCIRSNCEHFSEAANAI